jgi:hypothetical protein
MALALFNFAAVAVMLSAGIFAGLRWIPPGSAMPFITVPLFLIVVCSLGRTLAKGLLR